MPGSPIPPAHPRRPSLRALAAAAAILAAAPAGAGAQDGQLDVGSSLGSSLDSLLNTRVDAASKYSQRSAEAPASVTIVTADDIRRHGWGSLLEALETVRGLYVSNDRNYPYLGTRGFGRPTDYNNRVLLLLDGHILNEQVWGSAPVGSDLPIDLDVVERIEVVRGPGSVLYGTSAMLAVINIVTKTGTALDGVRGSVRVGSAGTRQGAIAAGRSLGTRGSVAVSGLVRRSDGVSNYFAEYDSPETGNGVVRGLDWEDGTGAIGTLTIGGIDARVGYRSRRKGIPTAPFGAVFGDPRSMTRDVSVWAEVGARRELGPRHQLSARVFVDGYRYRGVYPLGPGPAYSDAAASDALGGEMVLVWDPDSRNRITAGLELRRTTRAEYSERMEDGTEVSDDAPFAVGSLFLQNELQLLPRLSVVGGVRVDKRSHVDVAATPRLALVATPDGRSTVKLLYGQAFRAPSAAEAEITSDFYQENGSLVPERVTAVELEVQRRLVDPVLATLSLYDYRMRDLIDQVEFDEAGRLQFHNRAASRGRGVETRLDVMPGGPVSAGLAYAVQRTTDGTTGMVLTNSPARIGSLSLVSREWRGASSALMVRHESGRRTLADTWTPSFVRTDLRLGYELRDGLGPRWARGLDVSLRVSNLLDTRWSVPGGLEHEQSMLQQDGRMLSLRLGWGL